MNYSLVCIYMCYFHRFALAHCYNKCRRSLILEYFREPLQEENTMIGECCDACSMKELIQLVDCYSELKAIVQTVKHFPDKGEKQVGFLHVVSLYL